MGKNFYRFEKDDEIKLRAAKRCCCCRILQVECNQSSIVVTEPYFNFSSIQENMNELLFEEYDFRSIFRCNSKSVNTIPLESCFKKEHNVLFLQRTLKATKFTRLRWLPHSTQILQGPRCATCVLSCC